MVNSVLYITPADQENTSTPHLSEEDGIKNEDHKKQFWNKKKMMS
jgi:hypothetical protein